MNRFSRVHQRPSGHQPHGLEARRLFRVDHPIRILPSRSKPVRPCFNTSPDPFNFTMKNRPILFPTKKAARLGRDSSPSCVQSATHSVMYHSVILSLIRSVLIAAMGYFFPEPLLVALGAEQEVVLLGVAGSAVATVIDRGMATAMLVYSLLHIGRLRLAGAPFDSNVFSRAVRISSFSTLQDVEHERLSDRTGTHRSGVQDYGHGCLRHRHAAETVCVALMPGIGFVDAAAVLVRQNLDTSKPQRATRCSWITVAFFACFMEVPAQVS